MLKLVVVVVVVVIVVVVVVVFIVIIVVAITTLSEKLFQKAGRHKARDVQCDVPAQLRNIAHVLDDRGWEKSCTKIFSAVLRGICRRRGQARHRRRGGGDALVL